ncbi:muscle M-line assembly protein unc-89-like [Ruditapes philippinarum]|uniref:muscle M-line assembly protein unc-89-like n=1 Tax=Ruditapes philippinarum TaxID=129788 RepID=UPI00295BC30E|nr:muscle M-line assembly protein unc-89-like [Ruditapes philippinarum]
MDFDYSNFIDESHLDQTEQIKSIAKKTWLNSASTSLANLDKVQTSVYNVGLADPRDLKATNLRSRRKVDSSGQPSELGTDRGSIQSGSVRTWGSNTSIPDAVDQTVLPKPLRPASAKLSKTRPPSGRKPRPQSAKEPLPSGVVSEQAFGVKGAKYDPSGRPPKGVSHTSSIGWVGPPAGLKYPDRPPDGVAWQMDLPLEEDTTEEDVGVANYRAVNPEAPPPPFTSPAPPSPEPEERTKRVFELFIGDPYNVADDDDLMDSSDDEDLYDLSSPKGYAQSNVNHTESHSPVHVNYTGNHSPEDFSHTESHTPMKESLRLSLPVADDDHDEMDDVDTERLLAEAESVSKKFNLKSIISANKNIPVSTLETDYTCESDLTNQNKENEDDLKITTQINIDGLNSKQKAEELVSEIISENRLEFEKSENSNKKVDREKSAVKFNENITTVNITPRNIGRKVEELHHNKKKTIHHTADSFVDLIEIKNRVEPILSTGKVEFTEREMKSPPRGSPPRGERRPPSGKTMVTEQAKSSKQFIYQNNDRKNIVNVQSTKTNKEQPSMPCNKIQSNQTRPKSASGPLNRSAKQITTVTVDYGEIEKQKKEKPINDGSKKKERKRKDEVVTMMQKMGLNEFEIQDHKERTNVDGHLNKKIETDKKFITHESIVSAPTVVKSEHEKNYYEISRHSSLSKIPDSEMKSDLDVPVSKETTVYKTTKTLEFDELEPKEITVKSVIDAHQVSVKEKERFLATSPDLKQRKPPSRPSSAKPPVSKKINSADDLERPGSRLGFVAMAPEESLLDKSKSLNRPASAPTYRRPRSAVKDNENKTSVKCKAGKTEQVDLTTEEREKVIDNLLERTKNLAGDKEEVEDGEEKTKVVKKSLVEKRKPRPLSAHVGLLSRTKEETGRTSICKRPMSATTSSHKHYASYSRSSSTGSAKPKKSSNKTRVILTEPCIINTNIPYFDEEETEEDLACQKMEKELAEKGLHISAATLQKALYPPSGKSRYYEITANLPKQSSLSLLSHPKVWLPEEHKRLVKAEKTLEKANEQMFLQEKAEKRRAFLASLTPEQRKKLKQKGKKGKKGKKGGKKLRRSHSTL